MCMLGLDNHQFSLRDAPSRYCDALRVRIKIRVRVRVKARTLIPIRGGECPLDNGSMNG